MNTVKTIAVFSCDLFLIVFAVVFIVLPPADLIVVVLVVDAVFEVVMLNTVKYEDYGMSK